MQLVDKYILGFIEIAENLVGFRLIMGLLTTVFNFSITFFSAPLILLLSSESFAKPSVLYCLIVFELAEDLLTILMNLFHFQRLTLIFSRHSKGVVVAACSINSIASSINSIASSESFNCSELN